MVRPPGGHRPSLMLPALAGTSLPLSRTRKVRSRTTRAGCRLRCGLICGKPPGVGQVAQVLAIVNQHPVDALHQRRTGPLEQHAPLPGRQLGVLPYPAAPARPAIGVEVAAMIELRRVAPVMVLRFRLEREPVILEIAVAQQVAVLGQSGRWSSRPATSTKIGKNRIMVFSRIVPWVSGDPSIKGYGNEDELEEEDLLLKGLIGWRFGQKHLQLTIDKYQLTIAMPIDLSRSVMSTLHEC